MPSDNPNSTASNTSNPPFLEHAALYLDRRVITIFFLGMSQGFPQLIIGSALTIWLQESGLTRTNIGYASAIFVAYSVNFLWSPLVDRVNLGPLKTLFGSRRSWILLTQAVVVTTCALASQFSPTDSLEPLIICCLVIAVAAATQDISIDAFRIDSIPENESKAISAGAAAATAGWWTGFSGIGVLPLWLSDQPGWSWNTIYLILAGIMALLMLAPLLSKEPVTNREFEQQKIQQSFLGSLARQSKLSNNLVLLRLLAIPLIPFWALFGSFGAPATLVESGLYKPLLLAIEFVIIISLFRSLWSITHSNPLTETSLPGQYRVTRFHQTLAWLIVTVIQPLREFFLRNGFKLAFSILAFIFMFKMGEGFLSKMSVVFYKEVGFTNTDIAFLSKLLNWGVTIVFALLGGIANIRFGIVKGLFVSGIAMAATNLLFSVLAIIGPVKWFMFFTIVADGFAASWSSVAFVSVMSLLCNRSFSASQYALMVSLGSLGRNLITSTSGQVVDWLDGDWVIFFIITALLVIPSLIILARMGKDITQLEKNQLALETNGTKDG